MKLKWLAGNEKGSYTSTYGTFLQYAETHEKPWGFGVTRSNSPFFLKLPREFGHSGREVNPLLYVTNLKYTYTNY